MTAQAEIRPHTNALNDVRVQFGIGVVALSLTVAQAANRAWVLTAWLSAATILFFVTAIRMRRARVIIEGGRLVVSGTFTTRWVPVSSIKSTSTVERPRRYWSFGWNTRLPVRGTLDALEIRLDTGQVLVPEATRRPHGSDEAREILQVFSDAISDASTSDGETS